MKKEYIAQPVNYLDKFTVDMDEKISSTYYICCKEDAANLREGMLEKEDLKNLVKSEYAKRKIDDLVNVNGTIYTEQSANECLTLLYENTK